MRRQVTFDRYFCGNEISEYGRQHGYVDYRTLAKAFDAVLNNNIVESTGFENWETENGSLEYFEDSDGNTYDYDAAQEKIEQLENEIEQLENYIDSDQGDDAQEKIDEIQAEIDNLNDSHYAEIFQYYIIDENGAEILKDYTDEIVMYNAELDMYVWCVTHWGTSWDYVLTDIPCTKSE